MKKIDLNQIKKKGSELDAFIRSIDVDKYLAMVDVKKINFKWFTRRRIIVLSVIGVMVVGYYYFKETIPPPGPLVTITKVEKQTVPVYLNYVGNTEAIKSVDIRARVEGFLTKRAFVEGDDVRKGALMFEIDPKPFQAALDEAKAQLAKDQAALIFARDQVGRYRPLVEKEYVTRESYEDLVTTAEESQAAVLADKAAVEQAELNLGYCKMYAPFNGRIGRTLVNVGNLVGAGQDTKLANIVQLDPIYVYFSPSEEEAQKILEKRQKRELDVEITFADGTVYKHPGTLNFVDNKADTTTSTVTMRGIFPNPDKTLLPGVYTQVRVHLTDLPDALLVPERAIAEDQGGRYVVVINNANVAEERHVETGQSYDSMRVITKGIKEGEHVVVDGLQLVRPGIEVMTKMMKKEDEKDEDSVREIVHEAIKGSDED